MTTKAPDRPTQIPEEYLKEQALVEKTAHIQEEHQPPKQIKITTHEPK